MTGSDTSKDEDFKQETPRIFIDKSARPAFMRGQQAVTSCQAPEDVREEPRLL
jgi:hypothetical protein